MRCDMCGSEEQLFRTNIEGAEMSVCQSCSQYGKVISRIVSPTRKELKKEVAAQKKREEVTRNEIITIVKKDYPDIIKSKREKMGLKQDELAKRIGEKSSRIHQLETGRMEPSINLARKLERFLKISLIEEYEEKLETKEESGGAELTIGDMIRVK